MCVGRDGGRFLLPGLAAAGGHPVVNVAASVHRFGKGMGMRLRDWDGVNGWKVTVVVTVRLSSERR